MPIKLKCPGCSIALQLPDQAIGKTVVCPKCQFKFSVPPPTPIVPSRPIPVAPSLALPRVDPPPAPPSAVTNVIQPSQIQSETDQADKRCTTLFKLGIGIFVFSFLVWLCSVNSWFQAVTPGPPIEFPDDFPADLLGMKWSIGKTGVENDHCAILRDNDKSVNVFFGPISPLEGDWSGSNAVMDMDGKSIKGVARQLAFKKHYVIQNRQVPTVTPGVSFEIDANTLPLNKLSIGNGTVKVEYPHVTGLNSFGITKTTLNRQIHLFRPDGATLEKMLRHEKRENEIKANQKVIGDRKGNLVFAAFSILGLFLIVKNRGATKSRIYGDDVPK